MKNVILQPGREKSIQHYHPWIFSGAVLSMPEFTDGEMLGVRTSNGRHLGFGYFNRRSQIVGRMVSFDTTPPMEAVEANILQAIKLRRDFLHADTTARRLVNAEGDFLPGLIIDQYDHVLVLQIATLGMDRIKEHIVELLKKELHPSWIVELSTSPSRKQEGLSPVKQSLFGTPCDEVRVLENDIQFNVKPLSGQKTGFFLDLRQMRKLIHCISKGKKVLNCCSYTGAFSCYALKGGAAKVVSVDVSKDAIDQTIAHVKLNGFDESRHEAYVDDVFAYLEKQSLDFDIVILDPPAFAKQKKDLPNAIKAYRELNRQALAKMPSGSLLLTCSCSYHVDAELFQKLLFQAACSANRVVRIMQTHRLAFDHPINLYHPEGSYLKSFLLQIS